jgi:signal transduction histidine kinase
MPKSIARTFIVQLVHICLLPALAVAIYFLLRAELWFSALIALLVLAGVAVSLYRIQIRQSRQQYYESLLNKVNTAVLVTNMQGHIEWMNRAAVLQLGETPQLGGNRLTFLPGDTSVLRIPSAGNLPLEMAADSTIFIAGGREHRLITLKDIHSALERNEMEAWQKLIRVLTHEIMNSITPIISLSETLSERQADYEVMQQAMQTIHRRSKGLLEFAENYRRLTRLPEPMRTDVSVSQLFADLQKLFPGEQVHIALPQPDRTISVDRAQIEQVLINLLKNAVEATATTPVPRIDVVASFHTTGDVRRCTITVRDNGEGILPEVLDKIFVPFFTTKSGGSGIGLSLCKRIMTLHGGSISATSEPGVGSLFTLQL